MSRYDAHLQGGPFDGSVFPVDSLDAPIVCAVDSNTKYEPDEPIAQTGPVRYARYVHRPTWGRPEAIFVWDQESEV